MSVQRFRFRGQQQIERKISNKNYDAIIKCRKTNN